MDKKNFASLAVAAALGVVVGSQATVGVSSKAEAGRYMVSIVEKSVVLTHGDWRRLDDGGLAFNACGRVLKEDGGVARLDADCVPCEASWVAAPEVCLINWKRANGLKRE